MNTNSISYFGLFLLAFTFFTTTVTAAPTMDVIRPRWEKLGQRNVNHKLDRDEIYVTGKEGRFTALKLKVEKSAINLHKVTIHYHNGRPQELNIRQSLRAGGETRVLDLPGNRRVITKVVFWYDTKGLQKRRGRVELWGRH